MRFIGRRDELQVLEKQFESDQFEMSVVYGRRRIGKTTLLRYFSSGKRCVYFTAIRASSGRNLEQFSEALFSGLFPEMPATYFRSYEELFTYLTRCAERERLIVVIDEFPYLAEQTPEVLSILQKYIDSEWERTRMFFILSGSSVSFMEDEVLSEKSPLYGRRTSQMKIQPFDYLEAGEFTPEYSPADKALVFGVTGGIPKYLSLIDSKRPVETNIKDLFFTRTGYFWEEPSNLLAQEFRNVPLYASIIEALAHGATRLNEIADKAHVEPTSVSHAMKSLISTGIVLRKTAITDEANKKKVLYVLKDEMFRFWYRFVQGGSAAIELGMGENYFEHAVKPLISEYMGQVFEEMCRQYTLREGLKGKFSCYVTEVGSWWGTNPGKKEQTDIDVVGIDKLKKQAVIGECKYRNEPVDKNVLDELKERSTLLQKGYITMEYLLFSKNGFSQWLFENCNTENVKLFSLEDLYID